ncbi:Glycosyl transferase family protein [Cupriavidus taiwanensis]|nr:Glycosyl transferase family protein [Cupriavidus taiwanensis]
MIHAMVTISVVSHGQREIILPLLTQLRNLVNREAVRIIVTENVPSQPGAVHSNDVKDIADEYVANDVQLGFGANHNRAFHFCLTPYFCVLNPDVRLADDPFPGLISALIAHPGVAVPRIVGPDGVAEDSVRMLPTLTQLFRRILMRTRGQKLRTDYPTEGLVKVDWAAGMFLVFDSEVFGKLQGFDEKRYHMYCEDVDICLRVWLKNWSVTRVGNIVVCHEARRDSRKKLRYLIWHVKSMIMLFTSKPYWQYRRAKASSY